MIYVFQFDYLLLFQMNPFYKYESQNMVKSRTFSRGVSRDGVSSAVTYGLLLKKDVHFELCGWRCQWWWPWDGPVGPSTRLAIRNSTRVGRDSSWEGQEKLNWCGTVPRKWNARWQCWNGVTLSLWLESCSPLWIITRPSKKITSSVPNSSSLQGNNFQITWQSLRQLHC